MLVVSFWYQSLDGFRTVRIARLSIIPFSYKRFRGEFMLWRERARCSRPWWQSERPGPRLWTSADSGESVVPSVATASVTQSVSVASEASVDASVGLGAGAAPGWGGAPAQGLDDLVVGLLTQLLARFPPVVPQGAPGVPPVAEVQQRAAGLFSRRLWV
ncbi:unnamed protein product [Microthlaspi erraticum]|uniref:Uncharacterized protein n=1 Tax=Microthlaspi erraticum TaxID=1685480 RepID=A0A6D2KCK9_9BRAS|nr:unnamed protein product [Microthlaspi erraticum]